MNIGIAPVAYSTLRTKIAPLNVYHPEEPSTCTSSGHLEYWTCSVCKDSFSSRDALEAVPLESLQKELLPHSYSVSEISQTPSATKSGGALLVCSCGETALLTLPALSAADYAVCSVPSTCTEHGSDTYTLLGAYSVQIVQEKALSSLASLPRRGHGLPCSVLHRIRLYRLCALHPMRSRIVSVRTHPRKRT